MLSIDVCAFESAGKANRGALAFRVLSYSFVSLTPTLSSSVAVEKSSFHICKNSRTYMIIGVKTGSSTYGTFVTAAP